LSALRVQRHRRLRKSQRSSALSLQNLPQDVQCPDEDADGGIAQEAGMAGACRRDDSR
jgi:hypothetical protein